MLKCPRCSYPCKYGTLVLFLRYRVTSTNLTCVFCVFQDEPTNNLDIESIDALADAINDYAGGEKIFFNLPLGTFLRIGCINISFTLLQV